MAYYLAPSLGKGEGRNDVKMPVPLGPDVCAGRRRSGGDAA